MSTEGVGLSQALGLARGEALAVVGCGGKTSAIGLLAAENRAQKVLVMPTTKIWPVRETGVSLCATREECLVHAPQSGVQYLGMLDAATGKLNALPEEDWPHAARGYDLVLMEADGSRGLPCKGWRGNEPVVPDFTTRTIGVAVTWAVGRPATEEYVLRLPQFLALTGLAGGDAITLAALAAMVGAADGMFRHSVGKKVLLINQVDETGTFKDAKALADLLRKGYAFDEVTILAGSTRQNRWRQI